MAGRRQRHGGFGRPSHAGWFQKLEGGVKTPAGVSGASHPARAALDWGGARDGEQSQTFDIAPEAVDGEVHIVPRSLTRPLFAETIIPPEVLDTLPTLPDDSYPVGSLVFLTTDAKLYRNTDGSTWSVEVDGEDIIANSITAGQIAAGAIGTSELAADAVIANVANVGGTVVIDSTGITIEDGVLTLLDQFGENVLDGAGFGTSWYDFIQTRIYNSSFRAGTTTNITATTKVNSAATVADYAASLSEDAPYWVIDSITLTGTGYVARRADASVPSGFYLWAGKTAGASGSAVVRIFQDIPVIPGRRYRVDVDGVDGSTGTSVISGSITGSFRTVTHALIGGSETGAMNNTAWSPDEGYPNSNATWTAEASSSARYLRVRVEISFSDTAATEAGVGIALVSVSDVDQSEYRVYAAGSGVPMLTVTDVDVRIGDSVALYEASDLLWIGNGTSNDIRLDPTGGYSLFPGGIEITGAVASLLLKGEGSYIQFDAKTQGSGNPATPASGAARLFVLTAAGKDSLRMLWDSGAVSVIATEP